MEALKAELNKLTVASLKEQLISLGLPTTGLKSELVERLASAKSGTTTAPAADAAAAAAASAPAAEAAAAAPSSTAAPATAAPTTATAQPEAPPGKHPKIVFDDSKRGEAVKLTVIKPAAPAPAAPAADAAGSKESEEERLRNRAQRFNVPESEAERARKRAERFGTSHPDLEAEKTKKRKERFGIEDPEARLKARVDRFKPLNTPKEAPKEAAKPVSLGTVLSKEEIEAKRKEREAKFAPTPAAV